MKPLIWWRYINDIFAIWCRGEANPEVFVAYLIQAHPTIKFTAEWSGSSIPFLDTRVQLDSGQLTMDLHVKPTDTHQYLATNSCHPRHCKEAISFSQALRMRCICSTNGDFRKPSSELKTHLLQCGYEPSLSITRSIKHLTSGEKMLSPHGLGLVATRGFTGRHIPPQPP